jgi:hypothetical protein
MINIKVVVQFNKEMVIMIKIYNFKNNLFYNKSNSNSNNNSFKIHQLLIEHRNQKNKNIINQIYK